MSTFDEKIESIVSQAQGLLADDHRCAELAMPGRVFILNDHDVLALPRDNGDSRYPYGQDGFNFWVYGSGYMHCNEGLFSYFLRAAEGQEPNIAFFAGLPQAGGKFRPIPLMPVPHMAIGDCTDPDANLQRYTVLSSSAAYFVTQLPTLRFVLRVLVTAQREVCFSVQAKSLSQDQQSFFLSSYLNPFLRHQIFESGEDRWFKEVAAQEPAPGQGGLGGFLVKVNEDKDRTSSVSHYGVIRRGLAAGSGCRIVRHEQTASRYQYVGGSRSSLHTPAALVAGTFGPQPCRLCTFVESAIAGDILHLELDGQQAVRVGTVFQHTDDSAQADSLMKRPIAMTEIDAHLGQLESDDASRHESLTLAVGPSTGPIKHKVFNAFMEHLKRQVEFCSLIKGYIQLSPNSLIGIRDVFQALEGLVFWRPEAARAKMIEALGYTAPDGRCFRQYSLPSSTGQVGMMDLRPFIDQGAWVISTIATYLRVTNDAAFLDQPCGYHEIIDEDRGAVQASDQQGSVLEHLVKIMDYMLKKRDHDLTGCVRALYGDWNDGLDGLGVTSDPGRDYGSGVSVMATLQVFQNCQEMVEILETHDPKKMKYPARVGEYRDAGKELAHGLTRYAVVRNGEGDQRIIHGWGDQRSYLVGSFDDPDGQDRDGLTSNAFWVLSGMYMRDTSIESVILKSLQRLDDKYGFKTFEPYFAPDAPGVGRIRKLPKGTAENGASYVHATAFAVMALFQMGRPKDAWAQLEKILPFTDIHEHLSHSPFVMPNAYGHNEETNIDGQNMNDWQTGSSNVVLKTLIRFVFGFEPTMDSLRIQPAAWLPFKSFKFAARARGRDVRIVFEDQGRGQRVFTVNGEARQGTPDDVMGVDTLLLSWDDMLQGDIEVKVTQ